MWQKLLVLWDTHKSNFIIKKALPVWYSIFCRMICRIQTSFRLRLILQLQELGIYGKLFVWIENFLYKGNNETKINNAFYFKKKAYHKNNNWVLLSSFGIQFYKINSFYIKILFYLPTQNLSSLLAPSKSVVCPSGQALQDVSISLDSRYLPKEHGSQFGDPA